MVIILKTPFVCQVFGTHVCMVWHFLIIRTRWHPISLEHLLIGSYSLTDGLLASSTPCFIFSKQRPDQLLIIYTKLAFLLLETVWWLTTCIWNKIQVPHLAFARPPLCPELSRAFRAPIHLSSGFSMVGLSWEFQTQFTCHLFSMTWPCLIFFLELVFISIIWLIN